jgi:murein DD-endopeptidase MepM/ murein hydrolase activator NlpD
MVLQGKHKHPKPATPSPTTTTTPAPQPAGTLGDPHGAIGGDLHIAYGRGADWSAVNRDDAAFLREGAKWHVPPDMLKAIEVIESGGQMIWNQGGSGAYGVMQIKESDWGWVETEIGANLHTRDGQIAVAAAILGEYGTGNTPEERFLQSYYPVRNPDGSICLDCKGEDGSTPRQYLADMHELRRQIVVAAGGTTPATTTTPAPQRDVFDLLYGGKPFDVLAYYGQLVTWSCPHCYDYFTAYGLDAQHHWAWDVASPAGDGAPLYAPFDGTIVCAGEGVGPGAWGTGCAAYPRQANYAGAEPAGVGAGRLEILHADGERSLILGHVLSSRVHPGDRVHTGDLIGKQGGMNASHVHAEGRRSGQRIDDPRTMFGGVSGPVYVESVDIPQPPAFDVSAKVIVTRDGVPVLQHADLGSARTKPDLAKGDDFQAVYQVIGNDKHIYWVTTNRNRVPVDGTRSEEWNT